MEKGKIKTDISIQNSLLLLDNYFSTHKTQYWLEAGTALAAYRDGKILPWDHDIDVAIWKESMPDPKYFISYFEKEGYEVIIQKGFPFIDNIIQLKVRDDYHEELIDIDIYLYTRLDGFAYMRWIQKPEGKLGFLKKKIIFILRNLVNPKNPKWVNISKIIPKYFAQLIFNNYLKFHIRTSKCIYHKFPEDLFLNLKKINFYEKEINIPSETDRFLRHRYGANWETPDSQFNQTGKWKNSAARVKLAMDLLKVPEMYI